MSLNPFIRRRSGFNDPFQSDPFFRRSSFNDPFQQNDPFFQQSLMDPMAMAMTMADPFSRMNQDFGLGGLALSPFSNQGDFGLGGLALSPFSNPLIAQTQRMADNQLIDTMQRQRRIAAEMEAREAREIAQGKLFTSPWATSVNEQENITTDPFLGTQFSHSTFERQAAKGDDGRMYAREEKLTVDSDGGKTHVIKSCIDGDTKISTWNCPAGQSEKDCPHMLTYSDNSTKDRFEKRWNKNCPFTSPGTDEADLLENGDEEEEVEEETKKLEGGSKGGVGGKGSATKIKTTPKGTRR